MNQKQLKNKSRYMSKLLRHNPEDLDMDETGYVPTLKLLNKLEITKDELDFIVANNDKKRFAYNSDKSMIRASQGHNKRLGVRVDMQEAPRIEYLYHGTASENIDSILKSGLVPRSRQHVHLSKDIETAKNVGSRHSKNIAIFKIDSARMRGDNIKIWVSDNGVYLTDKIKPEYLELL